MPLAPPSPPSAGERCKPHTIRHLASALLALALLPAPSLGAAPPSFDPADAIRVEAVQPVLEGDVARAHREALAAGLRRAVAAVAADAPRAGRRLDRAAPGDAARYVRGYRIVGQVRGDLHYRLTLLVWVDRRLLGQATDSR